LYLKPRDVFNGSIVVADEENQWKYGAKFSKLVVDSPKEERTSCMWISLVL